MLETVKKTNKKNAQNAAKCYTAHKMSNAETHARN